MKAYPSDAVLMYGTRDTCPDIYYATGFDAPDPVVALVKGGKSYLAVSSLEVSRATRATRGRGCTVFENGSLALDGMPARSHNDIALALLEATGVGEVSVHFDFPVSIADALTSRGIKYGVFRSDELFPRRMVKSPAEIRMIASTQRSAAAGISAAGMMIAASRPDANGVLMLEGAPLTAERIKARMREIIVARGCIDTGTIVAPGRQAADPHECGHGKIRAGEFVVVDLFPRDIGTGYWGDMTRTFWNGELTRRQREMYSAVREAQASAMMAIKPGVDCRLVHKIADDIMASYGFETRFGDRPSGFFHSLGHGVGIEIHESPHLAPRSAATLEEGMVVTVEPGLYYEDLGGVRIEDTVVVTKDGCRKLARCPICKA